MAGIEPHQRKGGDLATDGNDAIQAVAPLDDGDVEDLKLVAHTVELGEEGAQRSELIQYVWYLEALQNSP
jgi:hypothetical protein